MVAFDFEMRGYRKFLLNFELITYWNVSFLTYDSAILNADGTTHVEFDDSAVDSPLQDFAIVSWNDLRLTPFGDF